MRHSISRENRVAQGPPTQADYERVVDEAATLRMQKVKSYGEDRYNTPVDPTAPDHDLMMTYSDVYRKFIRIRKAILTPGTLESAPDGEWIRDAFLDLANYALMGVQLCDKHGIGEAGAPVPQQLIPYEDEEVEPVPYHIDQVAIVCRDSAATRAALDRIFSGEDTCLTWHKDTVHATGNVFGNHDTGNIANLSFNYELMANRLEFEVLQYVEGANWHDTAMHPTPGFSHLGMHVDDVSWWVAHMSELGYKVAQQVVTDSHTNPAIKNSRRYQYVIFDTRETIGFDLKLIQRINIEDDFRSSTQKTRKRRA
jgi:Glyoxalase/Bleomycin resistance protein/Dioxygenase superfamily